MVLGRRSPNAPRFDLLSGKLIRAVCLIEEHSVVRVRVYATCHFPSRAK